MKRQATVACSKCGKKYSKEGKPLQKHEAACNGSRSRRSSLNSTTPPTTRQWIGSVGRYYQKTNKQIDLVVMFLVYFTNLFGSVNLAVFECALQEFCVCMTLMFVKRYLLVHLMLLCVYCCL